MIYIYCPVLHFYAACDIVFLTVAICPNKVLIHFIVLIRYRRPME